MKRAALGSFLLLAAVTLLVPLAPAAAAHTELILSTPADGEALAAAPTAVLLTFSEELIAETVNVSVTDSQGQLVASGPPQVDASEVTLPWPAGLAGGSYCVNYRVVSQDGHPVSGLITFTYPPVAVPPSTSAASSTVPTSPSPAPTPAATSDATAEPTTASDTPVRSIVLIVAGLAAGIVIGILVATRRRGQSS